jgi:hypothetical protein
LSIALVDFVNFIHLFLVGKYWFKNTICDTEHVAISFCRTFILLLFPNNYSSHHSVIQVLFQLNPSAGWYSNTITAVASWPKKAFVIMDFFVYQVTLPWNQKISSNRNNNKENILIDTNNFLHLTQQRKHQRFLRSFLVYACTIS